MSDITTILDQSALAVDEFARELEGETVGVPASVIYVDAAPGEGPWLRESTAR
ncbi:MAG TPA: hypothetical protein VFM43_00155 [Gaiellaceae bacterium]|nr:hypothetical protein [Gaiellaceae bacterium]